VGPRAGLYGRKISSPLGFDPGPSSLQSVAIPIEIPGPHIDKYRIEIKESNLREKDGVSTMNWLVFR